MPEGNEGQGAGNEGAEGTEDTQGTGSTGGHDNADQGDDDGKPNGKSSDDAKGSDGDQWRARARQHEDRAKAHKKAADEAAAKAKAAEDRLAAVLKAAGLTDGDEDEDPTEKVKRAAKERDDAIAEAKALRAERTAERVAYSLGADVTRTLDSKAVEKALLALDDPTDEAAVKDVIAQALKDRPDLKAKQDPPKGGNADMSAGGGTTHPSGKSRIDAVRKEKYGR